MDRVRVLRIIEYEGPRDAIERQVAESIHGTKKFTWRGGTVHIRVATIGNYPEVLEELPEVGTNDSSD